MSNKSKTIVKDILGVIISILITLGIGMLSALLAGDIRGKYEMMVKPLLSPPGEVFGIVWPVLYVLMGIAGWLIFRSGIEKNIKRNALILFFVQLGLNFIWSIVFFGGNMLWSALAIIIVLDIVVISAIVYYYKISKWASILFIPYSIWILFATYLNVSFALLN